MEIPILYEDDGMIAVDKPGGVVVNKSENTKTIETLQDWSSRRLSIDKSEDLTDDFSQRGGIVHRIDKDTSGIVLIAKKPDIFYLLQSQFKDRTVEKKYTALVHGLIPDVSSTIKAPVGRLPWNRRKFGVIPDGRPAETSYTVTSYYKDSYDHYTLVDVLPHTGRTHQIRIHFKHTGHALVGDSLYAGSEVYDRDRQWCSRLFLHARYLGFDNPVTHERIVIQSPLPEDLSSALRKLQPDDYSR